MKRKSVLTKNDQAIWDHVRASIKPMVSQLEKAEEMEELMGDFYASKAPSQILHAKMPQEKILQKIEPILGHEGMMRSKRRALSRGQLEPAARIDLHGERLETAHARFERFIFQAVQAQYKMVLVVTGKGGQIRQGDFGAEVSGVIRRALPDWVNKSEMPKWIAHYCPAHKKHGGEGAYYIFIRASARRG